jgi:hypothetical protein
LLRDLQTAIDNNVEGDTNFKSPCCKWTGLSLPSGYDAAVFGEGFDMNNFINDPSNMCPTLPRDQTQTAAVYAGIRSNRNCGTYETEYTDADGNTHTINFIHNYPSSNEGCQLYSYPCWCPQNEDGSFWNTRMWGSGAAGVNRNARTGAGWNEERQGIIICDQQTP